MNIPFLLAITLVLSLCSSQRFDSLVKTKKDFINDLWSDNSVLNLNGKHRQMRMFASDMIPVAWDNKNILAAYLEREKGRALFLSDPLLATLNNDTTCGTVCRKIRDKLFNGKAADFKDCNQLKDSVDNIPATSAFIIREGCTNFKAQNLYEKWLAGTAGPIVLVSSKMSYELRLTSDYVNMGIKLGVMFLSNEYTFTSKVITGLNYTTEGDLMPLALPIASWTDNIKSTMSTIFTIDTNVGSGYEPSLYPSVGEEIFLFIKKYENEMQAIGPFSDKPYDCRATGSYTIDDLKRYSLAAMAPSLATLPAEKLATIKFSYGDVGGFINDETRVIPKTGEFRVTFEGTKDNTYAATGLTQLPRTVAEVESLNTNVRSLNYNVGIMFDDMQWYRNQQRPPFSKSYITLQPHNIINNFYAGVGGPVLVTAASTSEPIKLRVKNVVRSPGIDIRNNSTLTDWDNGMFTNSRLTWAEIGCETITMFIRFIMVEKLPASDLAQICSYYDKVSMTFGNFGDFKWKGAKKYLIIFEPMPLPDYGHEGRPTIVPWSFQQNIISLISSWKQQKPDKLWWNTVFEYGQNYQDSRWNVNGMTDVIPFVQSMMFQEEILHTTYWDNVYNELVYDTPTIIGYVENTKSFNERFRYISFFYFMSMDLGWAPFGNLLYRYNKEADKKFDWNRYIKTFSEEAGVNIAPYVYYWRMHGFVTNITSLYEANKNLPVYQPNELIFSPIKWNETMNLLNFNMNNCIKGRQAIPYKFNLFKDFDTISAPNPRLEVLA